MSSLKVDNITGRGNAGFTGSVKSEGGNTTTDLQQGLAKAWADIAAGVGSSMPDSFNCSSIDDDASGECGVNIASDMSSANYSAQVTIIFGHAADDSNSLRTATIESTATGAVELDFSYVNGSGLHVAQDLETGASTIIHGDLA
jgi:hypothetical protein|tara:strand:- start:488 stop:919 length:432 start_codon:yes stop_codon:yes gene_type:complete